MASAAPRVQVQVQAQARTRGRSPGNIVEQIISAILFGVMCVLMLPVAAIYRIYDWLDDRRFERETIAKYGDEQC